MANPLLDETSSHMREMMDATMGEMRNIQPTPLGQRARTKSEQRSIYEQLLALGPEHMLDALEVLAERAGHDPNEQTPCELCDFLAEQLMGRVEEK